MRYAFGDCILDVDTRQVSRAGRLVHLGPKAYELLQVLLAVRPRVLSKVEIFDRVWPETAVSESSLSTVVAELREALGDSARGARYVRTVYGFGYAFAAAVTPLPGAPEPQAARPIRCKLHTADRAIDLPEGSHVLGRGPGSLVAIEDPSVSRAHARVCVADGVVTVEDLGSRNGTTRNGQRLTAVALLRDGDVIGIGPVRLRLSILAIEGPLTIEPQPASGLDTTAHHPAAVDDNRLPRHVGAGG